MQKLTAIVHNLPFGTGTIPFGTDFDASDSEAKILIALKRAKPAKAEPSAKALTAEVAPSKAASKATYRTRDMKAGK